MLEYDDAVLHVHVTDMEKDSLNTVYDKVNDVMVTTTGGLAVLIHVKHARTLPHLLRLQAFFDRLVKDHGDTLKECVLVLGIVVNNHMFRRILKPHLATFVAKDAQSRIFIDSDMARDWVQAAVGRRVGDEEFCDSPQ
jgi:hypothetical protein